MNLIEFDTTIDALDIRSKQSKVRYSSEGECLTKEYLFMNMKFFFNGVSDVLVIGQIPYPVALRLYNYYPLEFAGIYFESTEDYAKGCKPEDFATSNKLRDFHIHPPVIFGDLIKAYNEAVDNLDDIYVTQYRITNKEGLVYLITELKDYYASKEKNNQASEVARQNAIIDAINAKALSLMNIPKAEDAWQARVNNAAQWIINGDMPSSDEDNKVRKAISMFTSAVNPYASGYTLGPANAYAGKIQLITSQTPQGKVAFVMRSLETDLSVKYEASPDKISYKAEYYSEEYQGKVCISYEIASLSMNDEDSLQARALFQTNSANNHSRTIEISRDLTGTQPYNAVGWEKVVMADELAKAAQRITKDIMPYMMPSNNEVKEYKIENNDDMPKLV